MKLQNILRSLLISSIYVSIANTEVITSIDIQGNQRVDSSTILTRTAIKAGDDIDDDDINELVKLLHDTELFDDVNIQKREKGKLIIKVKEKPTAAFFPYIGRKAAVFIKKLLVNRRVEGVEILCVQPVGGQPEGFTEMTHLNKAAETPFPPRFQAFAYRKKADRI